MMDSDMIEVEWPEWEKEQNPEEVRERKVQEEQKQPEERNQQKETPAGRYPVRREGSRSYLTCVCRQGCEDEEEMLAGNGMDCLLPVSLRDIDGRTCRYYEVTGKQALSVYYRTQEISYYELRSILLCIGGCLERLEEYLLSQEGLLLEPAYLYTKVGGGQLWFLYEPSPDGTFEEHIRELARFVTERVDYRDERAVALAFQFSQYANAENFNMNVFLEENRFCLVDAESLDARKEDEACGGCGQQETNVSTCALEERKNKTIKIRVAAGLLAAAVIAAAAWASPRSAHILAAAGIGAAATGILLCRYIDRARRTLIKKERDVYRLYEEESCAKNI